MTPGEQARTRIDDLVEQVGWVIQDRKRLNLGADADEIELAAADD